MKNKIEIMIKTLEERMQSDALILDNLRGLQSEIDRAEVVPQGEWQDINEVIDLKRCSNCGASSRPTIYCSSCGSKNIR